MKRLALVALALTLTGCAATPAPAAELDLSGCDPNVVKVSPMLDGVTVFVHIPGPNTVTVDVLDTFEHRRLTQQVTKRGNGATFSMWDFHGKFRDITVTTKTDGTCSAPVDGLN